MKKLFTTALFAFAMLGSQAQVHNWWHFGNNASINFNSGNPLFGNSTMNTNEACASVSSSAGTLLFYTDGVKVYRPANAGIMADAGGGTSYIMSGGVTTTQTIIVPRPGTSQYYVFTVKPGGTEKVKYSVVDMSINSGTVISVNNALPAVPGATLNDGEQMTTVKHCNGVDYWLITHEYTTTKFKVYLITNSGIAAQNSYAVGGFSPTYTHTHMGYMKAAPNGKLLARCFNMMDGSGYKQGVEQFRFSPSTGSITYDVALNYTVTSSYTMCSYYGLEYSPNSEYLYASVPDDPLVNGATPGIRRFKTTFPYTGTQIVNHLNGQPDYGALQLAPDGAIYVARNGATYLSKITSPNTGGSFTATGLTLAGAATCKMGLPNFAALTNSSCSVASFFFDNQNQTITTVNTLYGPQQAMEVCLPNIYIDGLASSNEDSYHLKIEPITLSTWVTGPALYSDWICTGGCTVPDNFDISAYATLSAGQYYLVTISVGPDWNSKSLLLRPKNCPDSEASFIFSNNVSQFLTVETSLYGPQQVVNVCGPDVFIDGSASTNENSVYLHIHAFNLGNWTFDGNALFDNWYCINCSGGPNLNLADVIDPATFDDTKVYRIAFSVGAQWDTEVRFLRVRDCTRNNSGETDPSASGTTSPVSVFPNPGTGLFTLNTGTLQVQTITIYDMMGNVIREYKPADGTPVSEIDLTGYAAGVYSVKINTGNEVLTKRLIKN